MSLIKDRRKELGFSQERASKEAGLSLQQYHAIENGSQQNPTKETMKAIAKALETTVTELFFSEEFYCDCGKKKERIVLIYVFIFDGGCKRTVFT